jgi:hypothetical protein
VNPRSGLDDLEKRKFLTLPGLELDLSAVQPVASRYTDYATPAPVCKTLRINLQCRSIRETFRICPTYEYNLYVKAFASHGFAQQIMPYLT